MRQIVNKYSDTRKPQENRRQDPECTRQDTCSKCGDSHHREGFRCPASKHQCSICKKIGHFSSLCYQKKDKYNHKKTYGSPKAHQLKLRSMCAKDPLSSQSCYSNKEDSICLQLKMQQSNQAETKCVAPQHLVTNLEYVLEPHKKRTKFLRARIDTCTNVNILPINVYKVLYKDPDCDMLAPSNKNGITTYTTEKINVLGSYDLFVAHPETKCLKRVTFQVINHEGSVIVSCATSLKLGLIQLHSVFDDSVPDCGRLLYSEADHPNKYKYQNIESRSDVSDNASPIEIQSTILPDVTATEVNQCVTQKGQEKNKLMQCPAQDDTVLQGRKGQKMKSAHMQPQEPKSYVVWSRKPAITCKKEHQKDQSVMLPHKPDTMVKKPGQATQKKC